MKKSLEFSMQMDMSAFDRSIADMQRKLSSLQTPANIAVTNAQNAARANQLGAGVTGPTRAAQERATIQYRKELDSSMRIENTTAEKLAVLYGRKYQQFEGLVKQQKQLAAGSAEEIINLQKQEGVKRSLGKLENGIVEAQNRGNQAATAKQALQDKEMEKTTKIAKIFGGIGATAMVAAKAVEYMSGAPMRLEQAQATAIQKTYGMDLAQVYSGNTLQESAFLPERERAKGMAGEKAEGQRAADALKGATGIALVAAAAAAVIGSAVVTGGVSLGVLGAAGASAGLGAGTLMSDQTRERMWGLISPEHQEKYEKLLEAQKESDYRDILNMMKQEDPGKVEAIKDFQQNYQRNLNVQRTLGLTNQGFYGESGLQKRAIDAGFLPSQAMEMGQQIVGAGGSARMGQQAQFGLQMQRAGMTNASQMLGAVGGGMQDPQAAQRAIITAMAEGVKKGFDLEDFVEEFRRFTQAISGILGKTGAVDEASQDRLSQMFGMFSGEKTVAGVRAAEGAYERFQQRGSELGGRRGVMRFAEARKDPNLGRLSTMDLTELLAMRPEDLQSNNAVLAYYTQQAGFSSEKQLLAKVGQIQQDTRFQIPAVREKAKHAAGVINEYLAKNPGGLSELAKKSRAKTLPMSVQRAVGEMQIALRQEEQSGITQADVFADMGEQLFGPGAVTAKNKKAMEALLGKPTGKVEDAYLEGLAKSADVVRQNFLILNGEIRHAITSMGGFAAAAGAKAMADREAKSDKRGMPNIGDTLEYLRTGAGTQPQGKANTRKGK